MNLDKAWGRGLVVLLCTGMLLAAAGLACAGEAEKEPPPEPVTTADLHIPVDELELLVKPLGRDELLSEADAWLALLKSKVGEVSAAEITIRQKNREIEQLEQEREDAAAAGEEAARQPEEDRMQQPAATAAPEQTLEADAADKTKILEQVAALRDERTALIDRLGVVLNELNAKLGKTPEGKDNEVVVPYQLYMDSVGGIKVDVSDREAAWATVSSWVRSEEGGLRWARNIAVFLATVFSFWVLGLMLGKLTLKAFKLAGSSAILLRNFVVHSVRRVTFFIGLIFGLAALEINIGPLLALIGAAGFVVAFALQNTLSNFASGIMIMLYRPFDVGDLIDVSGVMGVVRSMNLVTTTITTADNQIMVVPNNSIWGNIITNITGSEVRRVDLVFGIGYGDDIGHASAVLAEVVGAHPQVLKEPEPVIQVHELAESSVNLICRPWARTDDYWTVYWEVTRRVKERFDAEGISIPFPQRDVHVIQETEPAGA